MKTSDFDYKLPPERIAQSPVEPRDASRLMVVHRDSGTIEHRIFRQIGDYLQPGDLLVLNQTRVIPARLFGRKAETGGKVELLLLNRRDEHTWEALVRGKGLRPGRRIEIQAASAGLEGEEPQRDAVPSLGAEIIAETGSGGRLIRFEARIEPLLDRLGVVPLPPYIHEPLADAERYQTVYGRIEGSVAASTAGLHFTPELLVELRRLGVEMAYATLHMDTFRPVKEERVEDHRMHTEWCELAAPDAERVNRAKLEGRRVIAVGTTVVRTLESAAASCAPPLAEEGEAGADCAWQTVAAFSGPTDLFIYPGYRFRAVDALITNFHLPRSTLLMLVSAFARRELILRAYREAIEAEYHAAPVSDRTLQ